MRIAEVSKISKLSTDTLRYYEKIGILGPIAKNSNGIRDYSNQDLNIIKFIKCMKATGLSIEDIKHYLELSKEGDHTKEERKEMLMNQRRILLEKVDELEATLKYIDVKIEGYE